MAKGDPERVQNQINTATGLQSNLGNRSRTLWDNYNSSVGRNTADYSSIMDQYRKFLGMTPNTPGTGGGWGAVNPSGYAGSPQPMGTPPTYSGGYDANSVTDYFRNFGSAMGGDPSAVNDPGYWTSIFMEKVGKGADPQETLNYLTGRITGGRGGGGGGGFGMGSINWNPQAYGGYQKFAEGGGSIAWDPEFRAAFSKALGGYGNFADTGGFSPQDIQDIRARAISPTRSVYSNAQQNINRQRSLSGFSPNYTAATAKMARDLSSSISDANVNANASIAQMIQQGKLAGLAGLVNAGGAGEGIDTNINEFNRNLQLSGLAGMTGIDEFGANLGLAQNEQALKAMQGMSSLYSATPGMASMFGDQALRASGLENQLADIVIRGQEGRANTPGIPWQQYLNAAGSALGTYGNLAKATAPAASTTAPAITAATAPTSIAGMGSVGFSPAAASATPGFMSGLPGAGGAPSSASAFSSGGGSGMGAGSLAMDAGVVGAMPLIAYGLDKGGSALLDWGERNWGTPEGTTNPMGSPSTMYTVNQDREQASMLAQLYGPDSEMYISFIQSHPWAA